MTAEQNPNCTKCKYRKRFNSNGLSYCDYADMEGHLRPVPVKDCQIWRENRAEKRKAGFPKRRKMTKKDAGLLTDMILGKGDADAQI